MRKNISILVSLLILSLTACSDKGQYFEESGSVFHTSYHIKYKAKQILTDKIDSELQRFNLSLNPFNPNSTIAKVNNNEDVEVDECPCIDNNFPSMVKLLYLCMTDSLGGGWLS